MANQDRYPLHQIILDDLIKHNKVLMLLVILLIISAVSLIWITHQTRISTAEQNALIQANLKLNNEYVHLELEENTQAYEKRATSLGLHPLKKEQEQIVVK